MACVQPHGKPASLLNDGQIGTGAPLCAPPPAVPLRPPPTCREAGDLNRRKHQDKVRKQK